MPSNQNSQSETVRVKTDQLPVGSRLSHPINDGEDRLLLAAGVLLTARLKERLLARGITEVLLHPDDVAAIFGKKKPAVAPAQSAPPKKKPPRVATVRPSMHDTVAHIKAQASALAASVSRQIKNSGPPLSERQVSHGTTPYDAQQRARLEQNFTATTELLDNLAQQAATNKVKDDRPLKQVAQNYIAELIADTDNVLASSNELAPDPAITERGVRLALLAMSMAIELDWDETHVREVGLCGLVHDFGMFRLEEKLHDPPAKVSVDDWKQFTEHPLHTLDMLTSMKNVSLAVRLAATQVHENPDGSGYPRGLKAQEIHPYANLLHTADAYITLTAELSDRQAFLSYDVMVYLLSQVKSNHMDEKSTRALLQVISLFPIGSHVRLNDGSEAQVIRRNAQHYTAPIVQRVGADRIARFDSPHASIIDLAQSNMRIMSPLLPPNREEVRLDESLMSQVLWEGGMT